MKKIALVTDSTADLTEKMREDSGVHIIPLKVRFGDREYLDQELTCSEFYQRLATEEELPKISQPSPEEFSNLYRNLLEEYEEIISVHISSGLSGTLNSAYLAKERLVGKRQEMIHIVDSKTVSLGVGLLVMEAARMIKKGLNSAQILQKLVSARKSIETLFTLDTLEYLQKGGRIGKVHSLMGALLNIKPVVRVGEDGIYHSYGKARSQEKALKTIVRAFQDLAAGRKPFKLAVAHGAAEQAGLMLKKALESTFCLEVSIFTQVGPVIGVHTGPGTVGAAIQFE